MSRMIPEWFSKKVLASSEWMTSKNYKSGMVIFDLHDNTCEVKFFGDSVVVRAETLFTSQELHLFQDADEAVEFITKKLRED